ncbi:TRAP transporter permease [Sulfitobacter geojensis]|uniref:TRAP transporter permease n=1 Tax=Sulfitobacter geojensis TaxID=1342299 RepID=UPI000469ADF0|nr:TRAP transporter permease [Sulfitobacter geojensis]KHA50189.1 TRAP transporter, 4TM/12TM fusion protein [Sulfitobacter geojensis]NYI27419.1 TRAP transporter 4TM/12TM fusion protein [Sulfitobacter geojensis]
MTNKTSENRALTEEELQDLVASSDAGARDPAGAVGTLLMVVAVVWSLFQVVLASPLANYVLPGDVINNSRQIHLAFAVFLAFMAYPAFKSSPRTYIPIADWLLGLVGAFIALYGFFFYQKIVDAGGLADDMDKWFALAGLLILFEGARRALGPAMAIIATIFLAYVFFGSSEIVPDVIRWKGASLKKAMSHMWITSEGVFGIALGVSTKFVFLFVLFGALLDKAGAGNYFIKMAFGALGHLKGGPAKAAVVGSAATGLISGSSIANVVTTGTFTIPLMKRVGFSSEKAGAVEVASSVNGQIMPPVMGAAAFLMVEYVGISYVEVITHAFLPATISYIALVYIVHLEAVKNNMPTLGNRVVSMGKTIGGMAAFFVGFAALCYGVQYPVGWVVAAMPDGSGLVMSLLIFATYAGLLYLAASVPDLEPDDPNAEEVELPVVGEIYKSGLYFLLPIIVLVYFLMIEQKSPGLSAFWATMLLFVILLTQRPLKAIFRGESDMANAFTQGVGDLIQGLIDGARNMIGIGLATATAGVIVGTVTLTGVGQVMADLVEFLSGGNLILMLVMVGLLSLILGMGLPTTANYIVVSSLMAGVVVELGAQSGLIVPLIAVHLFVFYFGIMADVTPPVGLASFAAAAVSGGDAIKTGFVAFFYSLRTVALPFVFIFNTDLLLIDVGWGQGILVFVTASIAILVFTAGTMGWFLTKSRIYESVALVLIAFVLFRPDFVMDRIQPPFKQVEPAAFSTALGEASEGDEIRLIVSGPDFDTGETKETTLVLPVGAGTADERLTASGLLLLEEDGAVKMDEPSFGSPFSDSLSSFDFYGDDPVQIASVNAPASQMPKELVFIPALIFLFFVAFLQRARMSRTGVPS